MTRVFVLVTILMSSLYAQAQVKIGFVDLHKAVQSSTAGKKARLELDSDFTKRKKELDQQENQLRKRETDLEAQKSKLSESAFNKKRNDFEKRAIEFRDLMGKTQIDFQRKELDLTTPILEKMRKSIARVAKQNNYTVVLEMTSQILYSPDGDDLTDRVVREFENEP